MPLNLDNIIWLNDWIQSPTWQLAGLVFVSGLWIPLAWVLLQDIWEAFQFWTNGMLKARTRHMIFLAIDVPRDSELTPASMEAFFNQMAGSHGTETWWEARWQGGYQEWFSFEIVSLEGYVQYIIQTHEIFRDLVEASIYAQYPDAEISEVSDYTQDVPSEWPNDEWDMFATEFGLNKGNAYPIKTYNEFEDKIRGELVDPMAALLEIMTKIGKGEQIWYQVLALPIVSPDWIPKAQKEIDKVVDRPVEPDKPKGLLGLIGRPIHYIHNFVVSFIGATGEEKTDTRDELARSPMFHLTPGERTMLEDMERKTGKIAYKCRFRMVYVAKKEVFNKGRGAAGTIGAIKQFNDDSKNWFAVAKKSWTKANYAFKNARKYQRQVKFYIAYQTRNKYRGEHPSGFVLNSEELATIYHFPMITVKAPLVKRTGARKSEPPPTLPIGEEEAVSVAIPTAPEPPTTTETTAETETPPETTPSTKTITPTPTETPTMPGATTVSEDEIQFIDIPEVPAVEESEE